MLTNTEIAVFKSCKIKAKVVGKDEHENSIRKILNFGHTFAHAYEASLGYSKKLNHGEAVILGIKTALNFCLKENIINKNDHRSIIDHITNSNLPSSLNKFFKVSYLKRNEVFSMKNSIFLWRLFILSIMFKSQKQ